MKYLLKNALVVSSEKVFLADVLLADGLIAEVVEGGDYVCEGAEVIDCSGKYLLPGVIDGHVHFREPGQDYKEDWEHASASAVAGGVTTILDMPNNKPPILTAADLEAKRALVAGRSYVNYGFYIGYDGYNLEEVNRVSNVPGVKFYACDSTGDMGVTDGVDELFAHANKLIVVHSEDGRLIKENFDRLTSGVDEADLKPSLHSEIRSVEAAVMMTKKVCNLADKLQSRLHIAHLSTAEELEILADYPDVTCEVAPHHLLFCLDDYEKFGSRIRMNPPIRSSKDVFALWKGIQNCQVDIIATDHAPHTLAEKEAPFAQVPSGVPGVEMLLPIMLNAVSDEAIDISRLVAMCCERPTEIFGICNKGFVKEGFDADLVLVDLDLEKKFLVQDVRSKCGWSPYEGMNIRGWPVKTFVGGKLVFDQGEIVGEKVGREARFE